MDAYFDEMLKNLKLTAAQKADAKRKYDGVAEVLHEEFYGTKYNGSTKKLIGSYGKRTNIRPPKDVDLLFKIPLEVYEHYVNYSGNGASALLQRIRKILGEKYATSETPKAWGKVVLIAFGKGQHDVELLPAYEVGGGIYQIPNTINGGGFESFDVGADFAVVEESDDATNGLSRKLIKIIKQWRQLHSGLVVESFEIEQAVASFIEAYDIDGKSWSELTTDFFRWYAAEAILADRTMVATARDRAIKARKFELMDDEQNAQIEWSKIFGRVFPSYYASRNKIYTLSKRWPSNEEEYIQDIYPIKLDSDMTVKIYAEVSKDNFITRTLKEFLDRYKNHVPPGAKITFTAQPSVPGDYEYYWKVRNFGSDANNEKKLRGKIEERGSVIEEPTKYKNDYHYVEVYLVKDNVCIARSIRFVPIGDVE